MQKDIQTSTGQRFAQSRIVSSALGSRTAFVPYILALTFEIQTNDSPLTSRNSEFVTIENKRQILASDEMHLLPYKSRRLQKENNQSPNFELMRVIISTSVPVGFGIHLPDSVFET